MATKSLSEILRGFRRRILLIDAAAGIGWGLSTIVLCLLAAMWLDLIFELSPAVRIALFAGALGLSAVVLIALAAMAVQRSIPAALARRLDAAISSGGQILSAVDISQGGALAFYSKNPVLSGGLGELAVRRGAELAAAVPVPKAVPLRPAQRSFAATGLLFLGVAAIVLLMPRLAKTEWLRFSDPYGDHPPYSQMFINVEPEGARILYGSGLDIHVTIDGPPVDQVELVLMRRHADADSKGAAAEEDVLPMFPEPNGKWRASISNVTNETIYFVRTRKARSSRYLIELITVPKLEEVRFRITPPEYTHHAVYEGALPQGGIAGLPGTTVQVFAKSNRPLSGGRMTVAGKNAKNDIPMEPAAAGSDVVSATFKIAESGRLDLKVADVEGQESQESFSAPITLLVDERPFVRLLEPRPVSFATPTATIPVVISAEDDYGLSSMQLFRSLNDSRPLAMDIPLAVPHQTTAHQVVPLLLPVYGLSPGDEIKLFARVVDNDPAAHAEPGGEATVGKGSESSIVIVRIISEEDFQRMSQTRDGLEMLMSKYQQVERRLESLAKDVETLQKKLKEQPENDKLTDETRKQLADATKRLTDESEALKKLAEKELALAIDKELSKQLKEMADQLERLSKKSEELSQNKETLNSEAAKQLAEMLKELGKEKETLDSEMMQPLKRLESVFKLSQDESRFVLLYRRQRELEQRLESLKDRDSASDPATRVRMRDLEAEQARNRTELASLLDEIEDHVTQLPEEEVYDELRKTALEFVKAVRGSGAGEAMTEAEEGLRDFSGKRGHTGAKKAADILEKFLGKCQSMGGAGQACLKFQPGMGSNPNMGESIAQTIQQLLKNAGMPGNGAGGQGAGTSGYSAQQNSLNNVGLYGNDSQSSAQSNQGADRSDKSRPGNARRGQFGGNAANNGEPGANLNNPTSASGTGEANVPIRYRRKVGRYFQRIADELGSK